MNARSDVVDSARCLVETWTKRARQALECGDRTDDPMGKRLVIHGGVIYANCAMELERVLNAALSDSSEERIVENIQETQ
jgi:hypothetical protein